MGISICCGHTLAQAAASQADATTGQGSKGLAPGTQVASLFAQGLNAMSAVDPAAQVSELFKSIDGDGDGQISMDEFKDFAGGIWPRQGCRRRQEGHAVSLSLQVTEMSMLSVAVEVSSVSVAQVAQSYGSHQGGGWLGRLFERLDADGNGAVSAAEFAQALEGTGTAAV